MLNDVKYKSSLTLQLQAPNPRSQHSIQECFDESDTIVHSKLCKLNGSTDKMHPFIVINSNPLSNADRTYNRMESFSESSLSSSPPAMPSCSNETIIPITYSIHNDHTDCNQNDIEKMTEISPKYCCTLEVKFVW